MEIKRYLLMELETKHLRLCFVCTYYWTCGGGEGETGNGVDST